MRNDLVLAALLAATAVVMLVFGLWPGLDLAASARFYDGSGFPVSDQPVIETLRRIFWRASQIIPVLALAGLAAARINRGDALGLPARIWGFILVLFVLGPGLLVNGILKAHWGRARPTQITEFGGSAEFTPFWQITDQCAANCSFVSGEGSGSMAMAISALVVLAHLRPRISAAAYRTGQAASLAMLAFVGWHRVAAGGHFLSDLLLSWCFTALLALALAR